MVREKTGEENAAKSMARESSGELTQPITTRKYGIVTEMMPFS